MNMKRIFSTLIVTAVAVTMLAIPAKKGVWSTIKLADGTEVRVELKGDENVNWMQAADGTCYVMNDEQYEQIDAKVIRERHAIRLAARNARRKAIYASTSDGLGEKGTMSRGSVPSIGEYTIPVVMVQFSDTKFKNTTTVAKMTRFYNEEGYHDETGCKGSVRDYFKAQSGGQFVPTFDVVGIVTLSKAATYYGKGANDDNLDELPGDVVKAAKEQLGADFSKYVVPAGDDYHTAGIPLMAMFYAGQGAATGGAVNTIWPCEWDAEDDPKGGNYENYHFNSFFVGNELYGTKLMGMSVFCHEFGHAMGLPDFYVTDESYSNDDPFGHWSIMDTGAYVDDDCRAPMGYNAYEKSYMGWLELKEVGSAEEVLLQSPDGLAENSAYIIRNSSTETFILENRQPGTWYPEEFGSGVLLVRIAYSYNQWKNNNLNNTQSKKRACVLTADGKKLYYSADKNNLYGYAKTSIGSVKTWGGSTKDMGVKNITKNADGTITLTFKEGGSQGGDQPGGGGDQPGGNGEYEKVTSASQIAVGNEYVLFNEEYSCANGAFDFKYLTAVEVVADGNTISGDGVAPMKLGGSATGYSLLMGEQYLTTEAAKTMKMQNAEAKIWTINQTDDGYVLKTGSYGTVQFNYNGGSNPRFLNYTSNQKPAVLYVKKATTGIENVKTIAVKNDNRIYTLDGRYVGNDFNALGRGLYIVNGKKVVK